MPAVLGFVIVGVLLAIVIRAFVRRNSPLANPNSNEPDVFASPEADLDPESDTGEPEGWN